MADTADTITVEEFIRILDRRPDLLEALRQRILTRELLELPERFAAFAAETRARLDGMDGRFDRVEGRLGNLEGWRYESKLARMLSFFCIVNLDMTDPVVLMAEGARASAPELNSLVQTLRNEGRLNAQDFAEIVECDAIARDNENRYALFEASMTVDESDVERAIRRSKLLAEIVDAPTTPVVIGAAISDDIRESAADRGVPFIHMSSRV